MRKEKVLNNALWIIFCGLGFIFIIIGIVNKNIINNNSRVETIGIISDIDTYYTYSEKDGDYEERHSIYIKYKIGEKEYMSRTTNYYSSSFYVGKEIKVYYNKDNPNQVIIKESTILFPVVGAIFFTIGALGITQGIRRKKKQKWLIENGELIDAKYVKTILNRNYAVNGEHPYIIICEWSNSEDNKKYIFKSNNIWLRINPEELIKNRKIKTFSVYINPRNKKQYVIDTKQLMEDVVDLT